MSPPHLKLPKYLLIISWEDFFSSPPILITREAVSWGPRSDKAPLLEMKINLHLVTLRSYLANKKQHLDPIGGRYRWHVGKLKKTPTGKRDAWGCVYLPTYELHCCCISYLLLWHCLHWYWGEKWKADSCIYGLDNMDWISKELLPTQTIQTSVVMMENTKCYYASKRFLWAQCIN